MKKDNKMLLGRQHLSEYVDYDKYASCTTTTRAGDDDTHYLQQPSTSRLYDKPAAAAGSDVIDRVMECNQPTQPSTVR